MGITLQKNIKAIVNKIQALNNERIERAKLAMTPTASYAFELLPMLFHYNYPDLPGYLNADVPVGVDCYMPTSLQQAALFKQTRLDIVQLELSRVSRTEILGLYSMGSTSSLGQSKSSDLDVWICVPVSMTFTERELLEKKSFLISDWFLSCGLEASFFLVDEERFNEGHSDCMSVDNCGSAQHYLLLDEFYRSAVKLAGRDLLWFLVPPEQETHYSLYVDYLKDFIDGDNFIDFGGLPNIPAEEYFGSSLWQLYKSIDSPYKSVLKTFLLESYSFEYPEPHLLSLELKKRIYELNCPKQRNLDAYVLMLDKVTAYLKRIGDFKRLELVRRCFYLKTHENLTKLHLENKTEDSWRVKQLKRFILQWGWSYSLVQELDGRNNWKIDIVRKCNNELLEALMLSYHNLIKFARRHDIDSVISPEDISVLARKLYAAFEIAPGKVSLMNKQLSPDLSEDHLTFIQTANNRVNPVGWYLYKHPLKASSIIGKSFLEYSSYLSKLVVWSYFNGLLVNTTNLAMVVQDSACSLEKLSNFVEDLQTTFSKKLMQPSVVALSKPCEVKELAIFLNLENDETDSLVLDFDEDEWPNIFSFGNDKVNLIASVDVVYRNSWHEVRTLNFTGETALLDSIHAILNKMHHSAANPEFINVFCYSAQLQDNLRSSVKRFIKDCIDLRLKSSTKNEPKRFKSIQLGAKTYGLFFESREVYTQELTDSETQQLTRIVATDEESLDKTTTLVHNSIELQIAAAIDAYASKGLIQFFFNKLGEEFSLYILDRTNNLEIYYDCKYSKERIISEVNHFYSVSQDEQQLKTGFDLPQFYDIRYDAAGVPSVHPYRRM